MLTLDKIVSVSISKRWYRGWHVLALGAIGGRSASLEPGLFPLDGKLLAIFRVRQVSALWCRRAPEISHEVRNSAVYRSSLSISLVNLVVNDRLFTLVVHVEKVTRWRSLLTKKIEGMSPGLTWNVSNTTLCFNLVLSVRYSCTNCVRLLVGYFYRYTITAFAATESTQMCKSYFMSKKGL